MSAVGVRFDKRGRQADLFSLFHVSRVTDHEFVPSSLHFDQLQTKTSTSEGTFSIRTMAPIVRSLEVKAYPSHIWKTCFAPMKWEEWDPDVEALEDISGECADGTTFTFVMIDDTVKRIPVTLSDVKENETVRFAGAAVGGLMKFDGFIRIEPKEGTDGCSSSIIEYSFCMFGLLGSVVNYMKPDVVLSGVEKGLENMKSIAEK